MNESQPCTSGSQDTDQLPDQGIEDMISYVLNGFFTAFFVLTGIVLNIICIIIHTRYHRRNAAIIQYYLIALTGWQTALLLNAFFLYCLPTLVHGQLIDHGPYVYVYPIAYTLANATHTGTVWVILMLTTDRYFALCKPLTHHGRGEKSSTKWFVIFLSAFALLFSLPRLFEVTVVSVCTEDGTECFPIINQTDFSHNQLYWRIYRIGLVTVGVTVVPCVLIFVFTLIITYELRRAFLRRKSLCPKSSDIVMRSKRAETRKDRKANIMLVMVIAKFLLSDLLPTAADVLELVLGSDSFNQSGFATVLVAVSNFLLVVNCSTNFWIFLAWGKHFRQMFKQFMLSIIFCAKSRKAEKTPEMLSSCCVRTHYTTFVDYAEKRKCSCYKCRVKPPRRRKSNADLSLALLTSENSVHQDELRKYSSTQYSDYDKNRILALLATEGQYRL